MNFLGGFPATFDETGGYPHCIPIDLRLYFSGSLDGVLPLRRGW